MLQADPAVADPNLLSAQFRPELLAPAGQRDSLIAAVENGADAVYFGLRGHNARARAVNFGTDELPEIMNLLHGRGVRGYVTLNTLVFPAELPALEQTVREVAEAGVDAVIVQDVGLARLIRAVCPDLEIHASTQMSITSAEGVRLARELGCTRVILARELSLREIARIRRESDLPVEVFVHGALCVAYSGQCLTSEALGGRSANRGECAQACRMPYQIIQDGEPQDLGATQFLLSPQDLAAHDLVPELIALGVSSLKIEGRLKAPEYVANITRHYRDAIDRALSGRIDPIDPAATREMELSFSRGFSHGFFDGNDHKVLVRGDYAKKRGVYVGDVASVTNGRVQLTLSAPVKPGDGLVFDGDERTGTAEQGGRIYEVFRSARGRQPAQLVGSEGLAAGPAELGLGRRDVDVRRLRVGQRVWKTDDPELTRRLRRTFDGAPRRLVALDVTIEAHVGEPLRVSARSANGAVAEVVGSDPLSPATQRPATEDELRGQFDRLGGTIHTLGRFETSIKGGPLVPRSLLNNLRRTLVERLDASIPAPARQVAAEPVLDQIRAARTAPGSDRVALSALCRTTEQVSAALHAGVTTLYADFSDIKQYATAVAETRAYPGTSIFLATTRIQKPGEANLFRFLQKLGADGLLVRNPAGVYFCSDQGIPFVADFSLNAANELAVDFFRGQGATRIAASYDLSFDQLADLLASVSPDGLEVVIHQQIPMFHMEHCVFCAFLSPGHDATDCGRPCDHHDVKLRDRVGVDHPLKADVGCRNTLYNAVPQSSAEMVAAMVTRGARHLRIEFLDDDAEAVAATIGLYRDLIAGRKTAAEVWRTLRASNQYGVTRGQLPILA